MSYAQQCHFSFGWAYVGLEDGIIRLVFDTREEAQANLDEDWPYLKEMGHVAEDWRVIKYVPEDDDKSDLI